jgi:hypothetical protein
MADKFRPLGNAAAQRCPFPQERQADLRTFRFIAGGALSPPVSA